MAYVVRTIGDLAAIPEPGEPGHADECRKPWNWWEPACNRGPKIPDLPSLPGRVLPDPAKALDDIGGGPPPEWAFLLAEHWGTILVAGVVAIGGGLVYARSRRSKRNVR